MGTQAFAGHSTAVDTTAAVGDAIASALGSRSGVDPSLGFLFIGPRHNLAVALAAAHLKRPTTRFLGCTTAGEFTASGLTHHGVAVFLLASDEMLFDVSTAAGLAANPAAVAAQLSSGYAGAERDARSHGWAHSTSVLLVDGLCGTGEPLISEILHNTKPYQSVVGGAAGDEGAFKATTVGASAHATTDRAAVAHCFGPKLWGIGVGHGLKATTERMTVTRAEANVITEIDGRPAFEVYRDHARARGVTLTPSHASEYMIANELGVYFLDRIEKARAPLSAEEDGSITLAAPVAQGSAVCILDGEPESMIAAARAAAEEALLGLGENEPAGVLVFDCVCRGAILKAQFRREIDAIRGVIGDAPLAGFLTYGEIARHKGRLSGWHNATVVVVAIPG